MKGNKVFAFLSKLNSFTHLTSELLRNKQAADKLAAFQFRSALHFMYSSPYPAFYFADTFLTESNLIILSITWSAGVCFETFVVQWMYESGP